jgi:hypothetical protein
MSDDFGSWTEEDDAAVIVEGLPVWHPSLFVDQFRDALRFDHPAANRIITEGFVTPESAEFWGDYSTAREWATGESKISTTPLYGRGAPDVAYVRLVFTDEWIAPDLDTPAHLIATLVWRPEIAMVPEVGWRIHQLGDPVEPTSLPRTDIGFDPRRG